MGYLYFLRHAIAVERGGLGPDKDRPLTAGGRAKLTQQMRRAHAVGLHVERVWSSPFLRCSQTAEVAVHYFDCAVELVEQLQPGGQFESLRPPPGTLIVGHEPDLSQMISHLLCGRRESILELKKAALVGMEWDGQKGRLSFLVPPRWSTPSS